MNDKICSVCGDRAQGYNFGAITCDSCRSFFRRTVLKIRDYKCLFGDKCEISFSNRKFCKKCRIEKCLKIGMRKESMKSFGPKIYKTLQKIQFNCQVFDDSTTDPSNGSVVPINTFREYQSKENLEETITLPNFIRDMVFQLSEFEFFRIKQLFGAASNIREDLQQVRHFSETKELETALRIIHKRCDLKCRRIVTMSTNITEFANLCEDDKIVLLKRGCPEINVLISIINFDFNGEFWTAITDENTATKMSLNLFRFVSQDLYETQRKFLFSFNEEWNQDFNIINFLAVIALFNPNRPNLLNKESVGAQESVYKYLLKRYLELKYQSKSVAQNRFFRLMNILQEMYAVNRLHELDYFDTHPNKMRGAGPLVEEIYDIDERSAKIDPRIQFI